MLITKFERVIIPQTLEGQKFADEYIRRIKEEQKIFISMSMMEDASFIVIESQYYEEVIYGNDD